MDIGNEFLKIADSSLLIADSPVEDELYSKLSVLLDLEDVLDKGRIVMAELGSEVTAQDINQRMDVLRGKIADLVATLPPEEYQEFQKERAQAAMTYFSHPDTN